jgi:hypothetical protein
MFASLATCHSRSKAPRARLSTQTGHPTEARQTRLMQRLLTSKVNWSSRPTVASRTNVDDAPKLTYVVAFEHHQGTPTEANLFTPSAVEVATCVARSTSTR